MNSLWRTASLCVMALPLLASGCVLFGIDEDDLPAQDTLGQVSQIALGREHSCAMGKDGTLRCSGLNDVGQLGDGTTSNRSTPAAVLFGVSDGPPPTGIQDWALGGSHGCALLDGGVVQCWGLNSFGQLGDGTTSNRSTPVLVQSASDEPPLPGVEALALGGFHSCALLKGGIVRCWGANRYGQLGDGTTSDRSTPAPVLSAWGGQPLTNVRALALGYDHSCALQKGGTVQCWGRNDYGQLGDRTTRDQNTPVLVQSVSDELPLLGVEALALGGFHSCALLGSGTVQCWGANSLVQLGDGTTSNRSIAVSVVSLPGGPPPMGAQALALGGNHSCALLGGGTVRCWGDNQYGQLGDGTTENRTSPVELPLKGVQALALGDKHSCALLEQDTVRCWGSDDAGQLGIRGAELRSSRHRGASRTSVGASSPLQEPRPSAPECCSGFPSAWSLGTSLTRSEHHL